AATPYAGLVANNQVTTNITVTCTTSSTPTTTTLAVGQSAVFTDSAHLNTALTLQSGGQYLIAVTNTDTAASALEGFTLHGITTTTPNVIAHRPPSVARVVPRAAPTTRPMPKLHPISPALARAFALRMRTERAHMKFLETWDAVRAGALGAPRGTVHASSLAGTIVGQVNRVYVRQLNGGCNAVDSIGARTVYVGTHVLVLADTNTTTWPHASRP